MSKYLFIAIFVGLVAVFSLIVLSPWIIEGPRRLIRRLVCGKSDNRASDVVVHSLNDTLIDKSIQVK